MRALNGSDRITNIIIAILIVIIIITITIYIYIYKTNVIYRRVVYEVTFFSENIP